jgi:hypothetical protein
MLTPEQADLILKKDVANIIAKSKSGKPLTKAERDALATATTGDGGYSINALAELTGADRRTLKKALAAEKPVRVEGRTAFYKLEDTTRALAERPKGSSTREDLICQKTLKQIELLEIQVARERGLYLLAEDVKRIWLAHVQQARGILLAMPDELGPALCGHTAAEIHRRLMEKVDATLAALRANPTGQDGSG